MKHLVFILGALILSFGMAAGADTSAIERLPIQDGGRIKPYHTFAMEHLGLVYGKSKYEGRPATEIVLTWLLQPQAWEDKEFFEIRYHLLKKALKLNEKRNHFSLKEILGSERLSVIFQELNSKREAKEKLDPYFQSVQRLENQIFTFREIASGRMMRLVPPKTGETWVALGEYQGPLQEAFVEVTKSFVASLGTADANVGAKPLAESVAQFKELARAENPELYPSQKTIDLEVHYNKFHPFGWSAAAYLLSALSFILYWVLKKRSWVPAGWVFASVGLLLNTYGFVVRTILTERAPVTNMYETVVWVGFGAVVFGMILEARYRWGFILAAGSGVAAFCLLLGDFAPAVLDASLQPLEPVLRSNFWLTTHVMTITISYAAFFLAFALGDIGLVLSLNEKRHEEKIKAIVLSIYRSIQIGVAFLAPGIILGGVWADYSWGRFWGWDPKETWALIALLGYLAILHGRIAGLIHGFGMMAAAVVTFSLVIMAWYGVNFVLGAGLHSYGFGAGGVEYVSGFVAVHFVFVTYVIFARRSSTSAS